MPSHDGIQIVFGAGGFGTPGGAFETTEGVNKILDKLAQYNVKIIDTAQIYGSSEELLGSTGAGKRFRIDTKHPGAVAPGTLTEEGAVRDGEASLKRLQMDKISCYYIHGPDPTVPIASSLAGINALHQRGAFTHFGLSNYTPSQVEEVYNHCKQHNYILPTIYQGNYNPFARHYETTLFPLLRKLNISFYAYSPLAGGFLTKTKQQIEQGAGRFNKDNFLGQLYNELYSGSTLLDALADWDKAAQAEGVSKGELAYRWVRFNSPLSPDNDDAIITGASSVEQAEEALKWLEKGPVSEEACGAIDKIWKSIEADAPVDNWTAMQSIMAKK